MVRGFKGTSLTVSYTPKPAGTWEYSGRIGQSYNYNTGIIWSRLQLSPLCLLFFPDTPPVQVNAIRFHGGGLSLFSSSELSL